MGPLALIKLLLQTPKFNPFSLMEKNRSVFGVHLGYMWNEKDKVNTWMDIILDGVKEGWVRPHVDRAFSFEEAGEAHAYIEDRKNIGKVVLKA